MTETPQEQLAHLTEMFGKQEDLHPDLVPYLTEEDQFGPSLKHPLVFSIMHGPQLNAIMNNAYEQKKKAIAEYRDEENWSGYIVMHERPYRLWAFGHIVDELGDVDYWNLLGEIWTDSENIWQEERCWINYLSADRGSREHLMEDHERARLAALPEEFEVWRGFCKPGRESGLSWTLDEQKARWFAGRLWLPENSGHPTVAHGTVKREDAIAYFSARAEQEIVSMTVDLHETEEIDP